MFLEIYKTIIDLIYHNNNHSSNYLTFSNSKKLENFRNIEKEMILSEILVFNCDKLIINPYFKMNYECKICKKKGICNENSKLYNKGYFFNFKQNSFFQNYNFIVCQFCIRGLKYGYEKIKEDYEKNDTEINQKNQKDNEKNAFSDEKKMYNCDLNMEWEIQNKKSPVLSINNFISNYILNSIACLNNEFISNYEENQEKKFREISFDYLFCIKLIVKAIEMYPNIIEFSVIEEYDIINEPSFNSLIDYIYCNRLDLEEKKFILSVETVIYKNLFENLKIEIHRLKYEKYMNIHNLIECKGLILFLEEIMKKNSYFSNDIEVNLIILSQFILQKDLIDNIFFGEYEIEIMDIDFSFYIYLFNEFDHNIQVEIQKNFTMKRDNEKEYWETIISVVEYLRFLKLSIIESSKNNNSFNAKDYEFFIVKYRSERIVLFKTKRYEIVEFINIPSAIFY